MRAVRKAILISCIGLLVVDLSGCLSWRPLRKVNAKAKKTVVAPAAYSGPRAKIALADFDLKAASATTEMGSNLRQMLAEALGSTNRFILLERRDAQQPPDTTATSTREASLIISVQVTEFEPQVSGGSAGIGGGGGVSSGALGGLLGNNSNKARMALEVRIADAATSEVLAMRVVQGKAADIPSVYLDDGTFGAGLSAYAGTPMEKAMRTCVAEAARFVAEAVPAGYYKY